MGKIYQLNIYCIVKSSLLSIRAAALYSPDTEMSTPTMFLFYNDAEVPKIL